MKKKMLVLAITVIMLLTCIIPAPVLAASHTEVSATGVVYGITEGTVYPAGESGRWRVVERDLFGAFVGGDILGGFQLHYKANIESTETQSGNMNGELYCGAYTFKLNGKIADLYSLGEIEAVTDGNGNIVGYGVVAYSNIDGVWTLKEGSKGNGTYAASVAMLLDPVGGHVIGFSPEKSSFSMEGKWK